MRWGRNGSFMELTLNLAWMMLAALMVWRWMRQAPRESESRRTELIALVAIILILLPIISVTDDLIAGQSLAETSSCQRKDHLCADTTSTHHPVQDLSLPVCALIRPGYLMVALLDDLPTASAKTLAVASVQIRPPPAV